MRQNMQRSCNCRIKESSPLNGKCLHSTSMDDMIYKAKVTTNCTYKEYYGMSESEFKSRCNKHTQSLRQISHVNNMEQFKYLWTLKAKGNDYHLRWTTIL